MTTYIGLVRKEKGSLFGLEFPDFPGCISAGSTLDEAVDGAKEALELHVEGMLQDGEEIPLSSGLAAIKRKKEFKGAIPVVIEVAIVRKHKRINITMDEGLLQKVDRIAATRGTTRSGVLAEAARMVIKTES